MQVGDFLHAEPTELTATDGAGHVITASIVHLEDVRRAARAWFDVVTLGRQVEDMELDKIYVAHALFVALFLHFTTAIFLPFGQIQ